MYTIWIDDYEYDISYSDYRNCIINIIANDIVCSLTEAEIVYKFAVAYDFDFDEIYKEEINEWFRADAMQKKEEDEQESRDLISDYKRSVL